jgi:hypothetical protein
MGVDQSFLYDGGRLDDLDAGIASEIRRVEGQDGGQAMHLHRGDEPLSVFLYQVLTQV